MMFYPPFSPFYYRNYNNYGRTNINPERKSLSPKQDNNNDSNSNSNKENDNSNNENRNYNEPSDEYFEIFGLKLYFDDILLICMIFFLYQEGVKDQMLFISLILLLLS